MKREEKCFRYTEVKSWRVREGRGGGVLCSERVALRTNSSVIPTITWNAEEAEEE